MRSAIKNGELIKEIDAKVPITSKAVQYSFSIYEALRVTNGHIVHLDDHLDRLRSSAKAIGLVIPCCDSDINLWLEMLIAADGIVDATVRILVFGGDLATVFITYQPLLTYPDSYYEEGVKCSLYSGERFLPYAKTSNLLMSYIALEEAKQKGCFESLLVNRDGVITEGTRSNFYGIKGDTLYTADDDLVLSGITRMSVLRAAKELGFDISFKAPHHAELTDLDGAFLSSTSMAAMPISEIDGQKMNMKKHHIIIRIRDLVRDWE